MIGNTEYAGREKIKPKDLVLIYKAHEKILTKNDKGQMGLNSPKVYSLYGIETTNRFFQKIRQL